VDFDLQALAELKKKRQQTLAKRSAAEIAADRAESPFGVACQGRTFEPKILAAILQPLPLGHPPQIGGAGIAGQHLNTHEDNA
jgi:hypothetical protein